MNISATGSALITKIMMKDKSTRQDLTGKRFGKLTVLEYDTEQKKWRCCCDCGNESLVATGHLNAGNVKSCGCMSKRKDLTGQRSGLLTVIEETGERRRGSVLWRCKCDCGKECLRSTSELMDGTAVSCGCAWRQPAVKAGQRFGWLVAVEPTDKRSAKSVMWKCKCDCGNVVLVRATSLKCGHTTSCGCRRRSQG